MRIKMFTFRLHQKVHPAKTLSELREIGPPRHQGQALMPLHLVKLPSALLRLMPIGAPTPSFVEWSTLDRRFSITC